MIDDAREVLGSAALALGHSMSTDDPAVWDAAARLARDQRPFVHSNGIPDLDASSGLITGEVWAAQIYNGDALALHALNEHVRYVHPQEGPHPELAHAFLAFIGQPRRAAGNAESVYFATCSQAAQTLLPSAILEDPVIYPPAEVMQRLEPYGRLGPRTLRQINLLYSTLKAHP